MQVAVHGACVGATGKMTWRSEGWSGVKHRGCCMFVWRTSLRSGQSGVQWLYVLDREIYVLSLKS